MIENIVEDCAGLISDAKKALNDERFNSSNTGWNSKAKISKIILSYSRSGGFIRQSDLPTLESYVSYYKTFLSRNSE